MGTTKSAVMLDKAGYVYIGVCWEDSFKVLGVDGLLGMG